MFASMVLTSIVYLSISRTLGILVDWKVVVIPAIIVYQAINFHHYIVDSVIWKVRKKPMQETLGLTSTTNQ